MCSTIKLAIVEIGLSISFSTDRDGKMKNVKGYLYPAIDGNCDTCLPITALETDVFLENDNVFNKHPNFSNLGFAFSVTDLTGLETFYLCKSGYTVDDVTMYNSVAFSTNINDTDPEVLKTTIYWKEHEEDEEDEKEHKKGRSETLFENRLNTDKYCKAYAIFSPKVLLTGNFTTNKKGLINNVNITFGNSKASLLGPEVFDQNNNLVKCDELTYGGLSLTTTDTLGTITFLNIYYNKEREEYNLDVSFSKENAEMITTVPLCILKIKEIKICN